MSLLADLFRLKKPSINKADGTTKTSGELVAEITGGANLVDGLQTWEMVDDHKHDIEMMKRCCEAELETMRVAGLVAAPYYFERVAILSRKSKEYKQEVEYCELYIAMVKKYYDSMDTQDIADVRKGPRYKGIVKRLVKAKELNAKHRT